MSTFGRVLRAVVARLPAGTIRRLGRLQFKFPALQRVILRLNARLTAGTGTIRHGVGAGLLFDATASYPGYLLGTSEPTEQEILRAHLRPTSVFYDVGANIGFFSVLAARLVMPAGRVFAFEPSSASAERARRNVMINGFTHVDVVQAAVGREAGKLRLEFGQTSTRNRVTPDGDGPEVDVVTLDDWYREHEAPPPTFVKIDVEGAEMDVLEGMTGLLGDHRPVLLIEIHWIGEPFQRFVADRLEPLGYALSAVEGDIPVEPARWHALLVPATTCPSPRY